MASQILIQKHLRAEEIERDVEELLNPIKQLIFNNRDKESAKEEFNKKIEELENKIKNLPPDEKKRISKFIEKFNDLKKNLDQKKPLKEQLTVGELYNHLVDLYIAYSENLIISYLDSQQKDKAISQLQKIKGLKKLDLKNEKLVDALSRNDIERLLKNTLSDITPIPTANFLQRLDQREKEKLRKTIFDLKNGRTDLPVSEVSPYIYEFFSAIQNKDDLKNSLKSIGFDESTAEYLAGEIINDKSFLEFVKNVKDSHFHYLQKAHSLLDHFYFSKSAKELEKAEENLKKHLTPELRYALNFLLDRRYGDFNRFIEEFNKRENKNISGRDNVEKFINAISTIAKDENYNKLLVEFNRTRTAGALSNLEIFGTYAFIKYTYPELIKNYKRIEPYFENFIQSAVISSQVQYFIFRDVIPELAGAMDQNELITVISTISLNAMAILAQPHWNSERKVFEFGIKLKRALEESQADYLRTLMNSLLVSPRSLPSEKPQEGVISPITERDFAHLSPEDLAKRISQVFAQYAPEIKNDLEGILNIQKVKYPREVIETLRAFLRGESLNLLEFMKRGARPIKLYVPPSVLSLYLRKYLPQQPIIKHEFFYKELRGDGSYTSYSRENGEKIRSSVGAATLTYRMWGIGYIEHYLSVIGRANNEKSIIIGSRGSDLVFKERGVKYRIEGETSLDSLSRLYGYFNTYKDEADTVAHLLYNPEEKNYLLEIYRKNPNNNYYKFQTYKLSDDEAFSLFGGYLDQKADVRGLFSNGEIKGLVIGYNFGKFGAGLLKNKEQLSILAAHNNIQEKNISRVGVQLYTSERGALQLGIEAESLNNARQFAIKTYGGKINEDNNFYAINLKHVTETQSISLAALKHIESLFFGFGFERENMYIILDYIDYIRGRSSLGAIASLSIKREKEEPIDINLALYTNSRDVRYRITETQVLFELINKLERIRSTKGIDPKVERDISDLNSKIDFVKSLIGNRIKYAIQVKKGRFYEAIGGEGAYLFSFTFGDKNNNRFLLAFGDNKGIQYRGIRSKVIETGVLAATLYGAGLGSFSEDKVKLAYAEYGRLKENLSTGKGSGYIGELKVGKMSEGKEGGKDNKFVGPTGGYFWWRDEFSQLNKVYNAVIGGAFASENLKSLAVGYGRENFRIREGSIERGNLHITVGGAIGKSEAEELLKYIFTEMGYRVEKIEWSKTQRFTASVKISKVENGNRKETQVNVTFSGAITWSIK